MLVLTLIVYFRRELTITSFDRTFAGATGLNLGLGSDFLDPAFFGDRYLAANGGQYPRAGAPGTPAATARLLTDRLRYMLVISR